MYRLVYDASNSGLDVNSWLFVLIPLGLTLLGSGLIDHSQKMTVAAIAMAEKKVCAQRS